jgi:hypothetical protein
VNTQLQRNDSRRQPKSRVLAALVFEQLLSFTLKQPVHRAQGQKRESQRSHFDRVHGPQIEDDEFARQRRLSDQDNRLDLDDMFLACNHFENGMFALHGDQQGHDQESGNRDQESEKDSSVLIPVSWRRSALHYYSTAASSCSIVTPSICFTTSSDANSNPFR